ncbi:MAG TPA: glycine rich domain-containing protein [Candidatus Baltobacteraceae bacterium]|nr:glycine rich domain-containing protein [Candidatus Baltobacteraceae bacterium]
MCRYLIVSVTISAMLYGCGGSQPSIGAPVVTSDIGDSRPYHKTFHFTGGDQRFTVPAGVKTLNIVARGAAGGGLSGNYYSADYYEYFGRGGRVEAIIPVRPGETLHVFVGGQGSTIGGFNGGGNPGGDPSSRDYCYGGGGASDVREQGHGLRSRMLVAAGGGGQGCTLRGYYLGRFVYGGKGGPDAGQDGGSYYSVMGGSGGTQTSGGAGGTGGRSGRYQAKSGKSGTFGRGGSGGKGSFRPSCNPSNYSCAGGGGGGGGGGYYGGGGGGAGIGNYSVGFPGGGGGGGSSYVEPSAIKMRFWRGWKNATGDGLVVLSWQ